VIASMMTAKLVETPIRNICCITFLDLFSQILNISPAYWFYASTEWVIFFVPKRQPISPE